MPKRIENKLYIRYRDISSMDTEINQMVTCNNMCPASLLKISLTNGKYYQIKFYLTVYKDDMNNFIEDVRNNKSSDEFIHIKHEWREINENTVKNTDRLWI